MPTLKLIDGHKCTVTTAKNGKVNTHVKIEKEERIFEVADRSAAYQILKYDLAATSDPAWANSIKLMFDVEQMNDITLPNGKDHFFQVIYQS